MAFPPSIKGRKGVLSRHLKANPPIPLFFKRGFKLHKLFKEKLFIVSGSFDHESARLPHVTERGEACRLGGSHEQGERDPGAGQIEPGEIHVGY